MSSQLIGKISAVSSKRSLDIRNGGDLEFRSPRLKEKKVPLPKPHFPLKMGGLFKNWEARVPNHKDFESKSEVDELVSAAVIGDVYRTL